MPTLNVPPVTPVAGTASQVVTANTPVHGRHRRTSTAATSTNPVDAPGYLYVDPVDEAGTTASGTTISLAPGQPFSLIPGTTLPTTVNSQSSARNFSVVVY